MGQPLSLYVHALGSILHIALALASDRHMKNECRDMQEGYEEEDGILGYTERELIENEFDKHWHIASPLPEGKSTVNSVHFQLALQLDFATSPDQLLLFSKPSIYFSLVPGSGTFLPTTMLPTIQQMNMIASSIHGDPACR